MTQDEIDFTKTWWGQCLADPLKMARWLQKLQRTELGGFTDHIEYMAANEVTDRERLILTNIANDELRHSGLICELLVDRNLPVVSEGEESAYWKEILSHVHDTRDYCAANYYGEALAAERFEIILGIAETPSDIRSVIGKALPDEIFHRETLMRLAGDEALAKFSEIHLRAFGKLTKK